MDGEYLWGGCGVPGDGRGQEPSFSGEKCEKDYFLKTGS